MRAHHSAQHYSAPRTSARWSHPRLSVRYNQEWDPLRSDAPQWESGWASFIRGLGHAKTWLTDQLSIGLFVLLAIAVLLTIGVLLGDALLHALRVWLGR